MGIPLCSLVRQTHLANSFIGELVGGPFGEREIPLPRDDSYWMFPRRNGDWAYYRYTGERKRRKKTGNESIVTYAYDRDLKPDNPTVAVWTAWEARTGTCIRPEEKT